jgi:antitoxin MazE
MPVRTKLIPIGNSRGVRLPKSLIQEAGLLDEVDIHVRDGAVIITSAQPPRAGWAEAATVMHDRQEDQLIDSPNDTKFDSEQWEW